MINENQAFEENKVLIDKNELTNLLDRVKKLEEGKPAMRKRVRDRIVRLRKFNNKFVVGWTKRGVYDLKDKTSGKIIQFIDLLLEGKEDKYETVDYLEFLRTAEIVEGKIKKSEINERIVDTGRIVYKKEIDESYTMRVTDVAIPVEVVFIDKILTVEVEDRELLINNKYVNL